MRGRRRSHRADAAKRRRPRRLTRSPADQERSRLRDDGDLEDAIESIAEHPVGLADVAEREVVSEQRRRVEPADWTIEIRRPIRSLPPGQSVVTTRKSTGPKTEAGKAAQRAIALHGLRRQRCSTANRPNTSRNNGSPWWLTSTTGTATRSIGRPRPSVPAAAGALTWSAPPGSSSWATPGSMSGGSRPWNWPRKSPRAAPMRHARAGRDRTGRRLEDRAMGGTLGGAAAPGPLGRGRADARVRPAGRPPPGARCRRARPEQSRQRGNSSATKSNGWRRGATTRSAPARSRTHRRDAGRARQRDEIAAAAEARRTRQHANKYMRLAEKLKLQVREGPALAAP